MHIFVDRQNLEKYGDENAFATSLRNSSNISVDDFQIENISNDYPYPNDSIHPTNPPHSANNDQVGHEKCWKGYSNYNYLWIITGPMTLVIFVRQPYNIHS